jgi:hypothetical protein
MNQSRSCNFVFFIVPFVIWSMYWLAYYPALMSPDSIWQWKQMLPLELNNVHPALHTLSLWLITRLWLNPAAVALFQILAFTLVCGWSLIVLRRAGVPRWAVFSALIFLSLHPVNGFMVITLWKDVAYSLIILLLTILILKILLQPGCLERWRVWLSLGLLLAALPLYRHNGLAVTALTCLWLFINFQPQRLLLGKAFMTLLLLLVLVKSALFPLLSVGPNLRVCLPLIHQTAAFLHYDVDLTTPEKQLLNSFRPIGDRWSYNPYTAETTLYRGERLDFEKVEASRGKFLRLWWRNARTYPGILLRHQKQVTSFLWKIIPPPARHMRTVIREISENDLELATDSLFPALRRRLNRMVTITTHRQLPFILLWRPAIFLYAVIIGLIVLCVRMRSLRFMILGAPVLGNTISLMLSVSSAELRYQYPLLLCAPFLLAATFVRRTTPPPGRDKEE